MSWQALRKPWSDTSVDYCDVCGNLLIHSYWEFLADERVMRACREDDEQLWYRLEAFRANYPPHSAGSPLTRQSTVAAPQTIKESTS